MKAAAPSIFTLIRESTRKSSNQDAIRELLAEDPSLVNAVAPKKLAVATASKRALRLS